MTDSQGNDSRRAGTFLGAALAFATTMIGTTLPTPLYPLYQQTFGFSQLMITVIFAVYAAGVIAALLITGRWSDQLGRRPLLFAGLVASALSDLVFWHADGLGMILAGRVLSGVSAGIFTGTATVAVMELVPASWERYGTLVATAANMGGLGLGPILAGVLAALFPMPLALPFIVHLILAVVAVICVWRAPETVDRPERIRLSVQKLKVPAEVRGVFVPAAIAAFAGFMVCGFFTAVAPAFLGDELGYTNHALIGFVAGVLFLASTVGQMVQGRLPETGRLPIGCAILLVGVVIVAWGIAGAQLAGFLLGAIVAGVGQGIAFRAGLGAVAAASPDEHKAAVVSTFFVVAYVAISVPVIGIGLVGSVLSLNATGLAFDGLVALLCCVALVLLLKRKKGQAA
ncbi:MFS transporter [Salinicola rhizosphaerae]|uniref:MFS transporter n=1 Tax=Salinicola rhizosphaerae TaxID=1443141 RepID=A0ABQ3DRV1_9GAMM|nr:MFS transporter [Salinicola rhizosphaerae]GHB13506.1 MFS transporter [Salinicola rhizosphaerae]